MGRYFFTFRVARGGVRHEKGLVTRWHCAPVGPVLCKTTLDKYVCVYVYRYIIWCYIGSRVFVPCAMYKSAAAVYSWALYFYFFPQLVDWQPPLRTEFVRVIWYILLLCVYVYFNIYMWHGACLVGWSAGRRKGTMMCFGGSFIHVFIYYIYRYDSCK